MTLAERAIGDDYLIMMPHRPLNPRMMFKTDPAMNAPCVARIPLKNL
jgi:hypothetical protein